MSRLRALQIDWNALVPQAQARGLRGVREVRLYPEGLHERITHRQARLDWLRRELNLTTALAQPNLDGGMTFGVELEFMHRNLSRHQVAAELRAAGIDITEEGYNHLTRDHWKITTDGSLGRNNYAIASEVVSPILSGEDGFAALTKVCDTLTRLDCKVTKKCGLHVHIGCGTEPVEFFKSLVLLYHKAEPVIDQFLAPSRRGPNGGDGFCQAMRLYPDRLAAATTIEEVATAIGQQHGRVNARSGGRYRKFNMQSMWQHGTVEFRHHHGTVEAEKATNWVRFCQRLVLAARKGAVLTDNTLEALLATLDATEAETRYFVGRKNYFDRVEARTLARAAQ